MLLDIAQSLQRLSLRSSVSARPSCSVPSHVFSRNVAALAPRKIRYKKSHKGRVLLNTGGSLKGTTLEMGTYGIRVLDPVRLSAKHLQTAEAAIKQKIKTIRGAQVFMRVFPHIPVCVKGNEKRMGKGKGAFHHWGCRATVGKVIFEIGGQVEIRPEVAREALRVGAAKLPSRMEFIDKQSAPRLGTSLQTSIPPGSATVPGGTSKAIPEEPPAAVASGK